MLPQAPRFMSCHLSSLRLLPAVIALSLGAAFMPVISSCKEDSKLDTVSVDSVLIPTMVTRDVETLISDSGVTRYRIVTPVWYVYDEIDTPLWRFPEGLNLTKFDNFFRTETTVRADSAIYYKNQQLWRLDGNVRIVNILNEKILTQQLFWNQRTHKIYSDSFVHIEQTDRVLEGLHGVETNEQMTDDRMKSFSGIFRDSEFKSDRQPRAESSDSTAAPADTVAIPQGK